MLGPCAVFASAEQRGASPDRSAGFPDAPPPGPGERELEGADYLFQIGVTKFDKGDYAGALGIFRSLADDGHVEAMEYLARMHEEGSGVPKDKDKAIRLYKRAADQNSGSAKKAYERLVKPASPDTKRRTASIDSRRRAYREGIAARRAGDFDTAYELMKPLAQEGHEGAQVMLGGMLYREGRGDRKNFKEAFNWYRTAAKNGNAQAQMMLGQMYRKGAGVKKSLPEAVRWLEKSTKGGNPYAPFHLATMYERGIGVRQDMARAKKYYRLSGERGYRYGKEAYERLSME